VAGLSCAVVFWGGGVLCDVCLVAAIKVCNGTCHWEILILGSTINYEGGLVVVVACRSGQCTHVLVAPSRGPPACRPMVRFICCLLYLHDTR
jgi:hypothetical protein